jgi:tellurite methyltransferase
VDEQFRRGEHAGDAPLAFLVDALARLPRGDGLRALDLASGAGRHSFLLASRGWQVTAVDWSEAALELLRARELNIHTVAADIEAGAFQIEPDSWDLICVTLYLQRNLFPAIRDRIKRGGYVAAAFPMVDERPGVGPMNPEFLLKPGELRSLFREFETIHDRETEGAPPKRRIAELFARKPA